MAKGSIYQYMGATVEFVRDGAWIVHRGTEILHTRKGWQEADPCPRSDPEYHLFEFVDYLAAERCIVHFARLEKVAA